MQEAMSLLSERKERPFCNLQLLFNNSIDNNNQKNEEKSVSLEQARYAHWLTSQSTNNKKTVRATVETEVQKEQVERGTKEIDDILQLFSSSSDSHKDSGDGQHGSREDDDDPFAITRLASPAPVSHSQPNSQSDSDSYSESGGERDERPFEERTCTIIQMPVQKLQFDKVLVYNDDNSAAGASRNLQQKKSVNNNNNKNGNVMGKLVIASSDGKNKEGALKRRPLIPVPSSSGSCVPSTSSALTYNDGVEQALEGLLSSSPFVPNSHRNTSILNAINDNDDDMRECVDECLGTPTPSSATSSSRLKRNVNASTVDDITTSQTDVLDSYSSTGDKENARDGGMYTPEYQTIKHVKSAVDTDMNNLSIVDKPQADINNNKDTLKGDDEPVEWFNSAKAIEVLRRVGYFDIDHEFPSSVSSSAMAIKAKSIKSVVQVGDVTVRIAEAIGEGSFGRVYAVDRIPSAASKASSSKDLKLDNDDEEWVLKEGSLASGEWESYIISRLQSAERNDMPSVKSRSVSSDSRTSLILMDRYKYSLLDAINASSSTSVPAAISAGSGGGMDELVVLYYASQLLKGCEYMWSKGIVHADLKPEHIMLRFPSSSSTSDWRGPYTRLAQPESGWHASKTGITFIDFGKGVDMQLFQGSWFVSHDPDTDSRRRKILLLDDYTRFKWRAKVDLISLASILYMMIWRQDCQIDLSSLNGGDRWDLAAWRQKFAGMQYKRGWDKPFWHRLLVDVLLAGDMSAEVSSDPLPPRSDLMSMSVVTTQQDTTDVCLDWKSEMKQMCRKIRQVYTLIDDKLERDGERNGKSLLFMLKRLQVAMTSK